MAWAEAYLHTKWHLDAFSRLGTIEMARKLGKGALPLFGEKGSPSNTMSLVPSPTSLLSGILIHPAIFHNRYRPKIGGCVPLWEGSWVSIYHNVARDEAYLRAKFHLHPSNRWSQYTNVTDMTDKTDTETDRQTNRQACL